MENGNKGTQVVLLAAVAASTVVGLASSMSHAAARTWTGAQNSDWSVDANWLDSLAPVDSTATDRALFNNNATVTANQRTTVTVETQSVNGVDIDAGTLSFTIGSSVNQGTLSVGVSNNSATGISVSSGTSADQVFNSTLHMLNSGSGANVAINNSGTGKLTIAGSILKANNSTNTLLSFGANGQIDVTGKIGATASGSTNSYNVQKNSVGTLRLLATDSTYSGATRVYGGTLQFAKIANAGTASSLGNVSTGNNTADRISLGNSTLEFIGDVDGAGVTDRLFTVASANSVLAASGSVPLRFTSSGSIGTAVPTQRVSSSASSGATTLTFSDVSRLTPGMAITGDADIPANTIIQSISGNTVTLSAALTGSVSTGTDLTFSGGSRKLVLGGTSTADNLLALTVVDPAVANGASVTLTRTSLTKSGQSKWILEGTNTYTGATDIDAGTLVLNTTGSISESASVSIGAGARLDVTAQASFALAGDQPFTFGLDPASTGSAGQVNASQLDISNAVVNFDVLGTLNDSAYVIATYTSLTGTEFASEGALPDGYFIDYDFNNGTQIAVVVPEPACIGLLGVACIGSLRRRRA